MKIDHVTAVVHDSQEVCGILTRLFGVEPAGFVELTGMSIGTFRLGAVELHINAPTGAGPVQTAPGLREAFLDPTTTGGVLIQLVERTAQVGAQDLDDSHLASLARSL